MDAWRLSLLGGFELRTAAGSPVVLTTRKAMALLVLLALRPDHTQSRDKLAALLWEDSPGIQARSSLRQVIAALRRLPTGEGPPLLLAEGDTLTLTSGCVETDVAAFERAAAEGMATGSVEAQDRALDLYRGDLFDGVPLRAPTFDDWLMAERQRLRELALSTMTRRLDAALEDGTTETGIRTALRILALDPLQEPAHRALMQLHARQGRYAAALKQYHTCRSLLERELGVLPESGTERLFREVRDRRHARDGPTSTAPPALGEPRSDMVPSANEEPNNPTILPEPEQPAPSGPVPSPVVEPELRHAAILCIGLAGVEEASAALDPEDAHALTTALFERIGRIARDYGGQTVRHGGDTALAAFGVRRAFGDDPWRAVRAALDIQAELGQALLGHTELGRAATGMGVRAGVACGLVVVDVARGGAVTGKAMHDAMRLAARASSGETLLCNAMRRALGDRADVEPTSGEEETIAWRLRGLHGGVGPPRHPFVGRQAELRQFRAALDGCHDSGVGTTIHLRGDPGIGKSRLVDEFQRIAAAAGFRSAVGFVIEVGVGRGQDALRALVRSLAGPPTDLDRLFEDGQFDGGLLPADARLHLYPIVDRPLPPDLRAVYEALDHPTRDRGRREAFAALVRVRSAAQPLLLVVEDVHWADAQTLSYLAMLAAVVAECRATLVISTRAQGDPLGAEWRAAIGGAPVLTFDLAPLRRDEAVMLASTYANAGARFVLRCVERAEGNPLFLDQLLRSQGDGNDVPGTIHGIVLARTDALAPLDRQALQAASILGPRFTLDAVRHLIGRPDFSVATLLGQALIRPDGEAFLFGHALVQEAVYGALLRSRRRDLHRRAAAWYADRDPVRQAEHLDRAEDPTAVAAYAHAAALCAADFRFERAVGLAERGLALAGTRADRFALAFLRAELLDSLGEAPSAVEAFAAARDLADNDAERCRASLGLAAGKRVTEDLDGAMAALADAEAMAVRAGLAGERARIHHLRGNLCFPRGDLDGCLREHRAALDWARQARVADPRAADLEIAALGGLGDAHYAHGRMVTAREHFERCVALAREHGLPRVEVSNLYMVAITRLYLNDPRGAVEDACAGARTAQDIGHRRAEMLSHLVAYEILFELGDEAAGRDHLTRARTLTQQLGALRFEAEHLAFEAKLERFAGRRAEACALLHRALGLARETGLGYMGPSILSELALCGDDPPARRARLDEGAALLACGSVGHNHLQFYRDAIDTALDLQDWPLAERYAQSLEDYAAAEPLPWCTLFAARGRALARWGRGLRDEATRRALIHALEECRRVGFVHPIPRVQDALAA